MTLPRNAPGIHLWHLWPLKGAAFVNHLKKLLRPQTNLLRSKARLLCICWPHRQPLTHICNSFAPALVLECHGAEKEGPLDGLPEAKKHLACSIISALVSIQSRSLVRCGLPGKGQELYHVFVFLSTLRHVRQT